MMGRVEEPEQSITASVIYLQWLPRQDRYENETSSYLQEKEEATFRKSKFN